MRTKLLPLLLLFLTTNAFSLTSYKYEQPVEVKRPGVYKISIGAEIASKAYPNPYNILVTGPEGNFVDSHLRSHKLPVRPEFNSYNSREDHRMVVNISLNEPCPVKNITVNFMSNVDAPSFLEGSADGINWQRASAPIQIKGKSAKYILKEDKLKYYRVVINTALTVEVGDVVVNFIPEKAEFTEVLDAKFDITSKDDYTTLKVFLPYSNIDIYALRVYATPNALNEKPVLASLYKQYLNFYEVVNTFNTSFVDVEGKKDRKDIIVSLNNSKADVLALDIFRTPGLKIQKVELVVLKSELVFNALQKGEYSVFFGSESKSAKAKNIALDSKNSIALPYKLAISGNPAYEDLTADALRPSNKRAYAEEKAEVSVPLTIKQIGVQRLAVPFQGGQLKKIRILKEGAEVPFTLGSGADFISKPALVSKGGGAYKIHSDLAAVNSDEITLFTGSSTAFLVNAEIIKTPASAKEEKANEHISSFIWDYNSKFASPYRTLEAPFTGGDNYLLDLSVYEGEKPASVNAAYLKHKLNTVFFYADDTNGYVLIYEPSLPDAKYKIKDLTSQLAVSAPSDALPDYALFLRSYQKPCNHGLTLYAKWVISTILTVLVILMIGNYTKRAIRVKRVKKKKAAMAAARKTKPGGNLP